MSGSKSGGSGSSRRPSSEPPSEGSRSAGSRSAARKSAKAGSSGSEPAFAPSRMAAITVLLGALIVILSQLVTAYVLKSDLDEVVDTVTLVDKHGYVPIILAVIAVIALIYTVRSGNRTGALLIAVIGLTIVFVFLIVDLPDVGSNGLFNTPTAGNLNATAKASTGLWLELIGGVILAFSGFALSTLDAAGLKSIGPQGKGPKKRPARPATADESN